MRALLLPSLLLIGATAACGGGSSASDDPTLITASATSCGVAATSLPAGKHVFSVKNAGSQATEVYLYGKGAGGAYDKVLGEVENVGPGISRKLTATLTGADVEIACKPGQQGDGIRTRITVTGGTANTAAAYDRAVVVTATDFALNGDFAPAKVGERVQFTLQNNGEATHEFEVLDASGANIGEVGPTKPGKKGEVVITFAKAGSYTYLCGIGDHAGRGMKGTIVVS